AGLETGREEAEGGTDPARAANARAEREWLVAELARAVGLGGRDRRGASHAQGAPLKPNKGVRAAQANPPRAAPGEPTRGIRGGEGPPAPRRPGLGAASARHDPHRPLLLLHSRSARPDRLGTLTVESFDTRLEPCTPVECHDPPDRWRPHGRTPWPTADSGFRNKLI